MEKEEKKESCCENNWFCGCGEGLHKCGYRWKKCRIMRIILVIIAIIAIFSFGSEWGEMKGQLKNSRHLEGRAMPCNCIRMSNDFGKTNIPKTFGSGVTVEVNKLPDAPKQ